MLSPRFSVGPADVRAWSVEDLVDAHILLDMYEDMENRAAQPPRGTLAK